MVSLYVQEDICLSQPMACGVFHHPHHPRYAPNKGDAGRAQWRGDDEFRFAVVPIF